MTVIRPPVRASGSSLSSKKQIGKKASPSWCVYLIVSATLPKTYVGATTNFCRRLNQHNGDLKGGAKASRGGRPWACGCIIRGFRDKSEACEFEWKWKNFSRKLSRKKNTACCEEKDKSGLISLLNHREATLNRVTSSCDSSHLQINWSHSVWEAPATGVCHGAIIN